MADPDGNVARAVKLETATISDALDRLGIVGQCYGIKGRDPDFRMAGRAFTMRCGPNSTPPGTVGDYIDDVPEGAVVVIDNHGRTDATIWGDILTEIAHRRRLAGTVIDGVSRDVHLCRTLGYPIFSLDHWMRTGKDRVQVEEMNCVVAIGGARVGPGDILVGDPDGVIVIPHEHEEAVLAAAEEIEAAEDSIRAAVRGGMRLDEARRQFKYHSLQTRKDAE
ncbi:RraA family protein [Aurantiacibacter xanthus]|uniref:Putative 4-hydroxy-4-methyl-2-oxoglutarate aldolase n=1 Tax=Aurantiacibacter xanthus TaxID=1784712 RepID=A0A3A1P2Y4_9SPHN|nr:RraA family protein [Aurantiacibacter xanthus]RIV82638.1 RraA family protein [Aurantiacibacter xanthus]